MTIANKTKLLEIAKEAYNNRSSLIQKYKKEGGNVVIDLPHGCKYVYGETIKDPIIDFGQGNTIKDLDFFEEYFWKTWK